MNGERQFGPYRLVRQIAVGGMAEIYLAKTKGIAGFEKYVALKMIHPNFSTDDQFIEMLIDEAKISVQLQHVNVAQTFDLGRVGDTYYITMEFVDGADMYKLLKRASEKGVDMPIDIAAYIAKDIANGLDYAHRKRDHSGVSLGIVHRDISPQNVLISHSGEVKLVDFGIAKATMKARQTAAGVIKGKYYYMSPEQAWGDPVDHRTDIFSVGILLYESLTGQMLYLEEDLHRLLDMVRKAQIAPPSTMRRGIPPRLERIVMNALQKNREDRYQTAGDMATDLERFLHAHSPVFTPSKLATYFQSVLDDEPPPPSVQVQRPSVPEPSMVTMRLEAADLILERSELIDENSVIFRVSELEEKAAEEQRAPSLSEIQSRRSPADSTRQLPSRPPPDPHSVLDHIGEQTMITAPPGFGAGSDGDIDSTINMSDGLPPGMSLPGMQPRGGGSGGDDFPDSSEFEPTLIGTQWDSQPDESGQPMLVGDGEVDEEGPTMRRDSPAQLQRVLERNRQQAAARPAAASPAPTATKSTKSKKRGPAHPALSAQNPQPALSAIRSPRRSRKTPVNHLAGGSEGSGPSVLSALVGQGQGGMAPVRRGGPGQGPGQPGSGRPGPGMAPMGPGAPGAGSRPGSGPQQPAPGMARPPMPGMGNPGTGPQPPMPGMGNPGTGPQPPMPGMGNPGTGPQPPMPGMGMPQHPGMAPGSGPVSPYNMPPQGFPGSPLPGGTGPMTFTKQLQALELEEIPAAFKIGRSQRRWVLPTVLAAACVAMGVVIGIFLFTGDDGMPDKTILRITSIPGGATVTIADNALPEPTPTEWAEAQPGVPYTITVQRKGHKTETRRVTVGVDGGEVSFVLDRALVSLVIESEPPGAEIFLNGKPKGKTPAILKGLNASQSRTLRLELRGHQSYREELDWGEEVTMEKMIKLEKGSRSR